MASVYPTDLFFGQWPLCTLLAGYNLSLQKIVLDIEIITTTVPGKKLYQAVKLIVPVGSYNISRNQDAGYNSLLRRSHSNQEGTKGSLTGKGHNKANLL